MPATDHNHILKSTVAECFRPFGIIQKGQSRTFLKDHGWYTIIIEFQPSSWSKGTYLNIGVDCHFFPQEHLAFSYAHRESAFEEFENEDQFKALLLKLSELAINRVKALEGEFADPATAIKTLESKYRESGWKNYDLALLYALAGYRDKSIAAFEKLIAEPSNYEWEEERKQKAEEILEWVKKGESLDRKLNQLIESVRKLKNLG